MPAQSPVRVTKKEPDNYDIEVPRGLCVTAEGKRCQAKANAKGPIKESFRFLLEREPNTSDPSLVPHHRHQSLFPEYECEIRRRLARWASTQPAVPGIMSRTSFTLSPLP
jgi:hypothetical protein